VGTRLRCPVELERLHVRGNGRAARTSSHRRAVGSGDSGIHGVAYACVREDQALSFGAQRLDLISRFGAASISRGSNPGAGAFSGRVDRLAGTVRARRGRDPGSPAGSSAFAASWSRRVEEVQPIEPGRQWTRPSSCRRLPRTPRSARGFRAPDPRGTRSQRIRRVVRCASSSTEAGRAAGVGRRAPLHAGRPPRRRRGTGSSTPSRWGHGRPGLASSTRASTPYLLNGGRPRARTSGKTRESCQRCAGVRDHPRRGRLISGHLAPGAGDRGLGRRSGARRNVRAAPASIACSSHHGADAEDAWARADAAGFRHTRGGPRPSTGC
jgi:hypothetical protein